MSRSLATEPQHEFTNEHVDYTAPPPFPSPVDRTLTDQGADATSSKELEKANTNTPEQRPKGCLHWLCCICCPCLPMWMRYICCLVFIVIIALAITAGVLAALFKRPQVVFNGPTDDPNGLPRFQRNGSSTAFSINLGLNFSVVNPNVESITFDTIKAVAYYPTAPTVPVGGGMLSNLQINSYTTTNFIFPFQVRYDPKNDSGFAMLNDILSKCGLRGGGTKQDLSINYDLTPTIRILSFPFSITLHQSASFACPITVSADLALRELNIAQDGEFPLPPSI